MRTLATRWRSIRRLRSGDATPRTYADLFRQDHSFDHWSIDYATRLVRRHPPDHPILIQTSMSPSGPFHVGNFRDTACAYLVHRALTQLGRRSTILLSFDDYDPIRPAQAARDPELRDHAGQAQGALVERATRLCRTYLDELRRLDIGLAGSDTDGSASPQWIVHYQRDRYQTNTYRRLQNRYLRGATQLARLLGTADERDLFAVYCERCHRNTTDVHAIGPDRVQYRCRSCQSVRSTTDLGVVKPIWALDWTLRVAHEGIDCEPAGQDHCSAGSTMDRTRVIYQRFLDRPQPIIVPYGLVRRVDEKSKISGSRSGALTLSDLLAVMPPIMILWLYGRGNCLSDFRLGLDAASMARAYAEFDRFTASIGEDRRATTLHRLFTDDPPPRGVAPWSTVLGALHSASYDRQVALDDLVGSHPLADGERLAERIEHAHAWLSTHGRPRTWIVAAAGPNGQPAAKHWNHGRWDRAHYQSIYQRLFGTESGPPLRRLEQQFGRATLVEAFDHPDPHPLRSTVLANLDGTERRPVDGGERLLAAQGRHV